MTIVLALSIFVTGYASYFFISHSQYIQERLRQQFGEERMSLLWTVFQRLAGVFCLGLFPGFFLVSLSFWRFSDLGLEMNLSKTVLIWTSGIGICVLAICYFFSRKPENFKISPQIRDTPWTVKTIVLNSGSWLLYLAAYEFLFRGLLLFTFYSTLGLWPAIIITTCLYVIVHIPKGLKEVLGAIPFGVVLGLITIEASSIWPAFLVHSILALSNDHFALRAHPDMHYKVFEKQRAN